MLNTTRVHTVVIGGGQAGLSVGYHLRQQEIPFVILDANRRVGDAWRNRWDSLRLFTPRRYSGLPGLKFPDPGDGTLPTKDEMANYLESYANHFRLPVERGVRVESVIRQGRRFIVSAGLRRYEAENVVVAMANYQVPKVPTYAQDLSMDVVQLHAHEYRNPSQLQSGNVLVVGAGNSGAEIAFELSRSHQVLLSGTESGAIPFRIDTLAARLVFSHLFRFVAHHLLTLSTPMGRRARPKMLHKAAPLVRVKPQDLAAAGVERVARVVGVSNGNPLLSDRRELEIKNVIWCTGYDPGFSWIKLPVFGPDGLPQHERGVVASAPGLYFVGLQFQYAFSSSTLMGVARDAEYIVNALARRPRLQPATETQQMAIA